MTLEFRGYVTASDFSGNSSYTVPTTGLTGGTGTDVQNGDLLVAVSANSCISNQSRGTSGTGLTFSSEASLYSNDNADTSLAVDVAYCNITPPATLDVLKRNNAQDSAAVILLVFRGHDTTTWIDVATTTDTSINGNDPDPPSITPATADALVIACGAGAFNNSVGPFTLTAGPSGYSDFITIMENGGSTRGILLGTATKVWTSGAEDPSAFTPDGTNGNSSWAAATLAIRPSTGGGGPTGGIKVWDGASWGIKPVKVWDGASWNVKPVKYWGGASWTKTA
jgi:hypothetical protein